MLGICLLAVIPVRKSPDSTSEIVTQLVFGDQVIIHHTDNGWVDITTVYDQYHGFVSEKQLNPYQQEITDWTINTHFPFLPITVNQEVIYVPAGASIPAKKQFTINNQLFEYTNMLELSLPIDLIAKRYMHAPYLWGGKTFYGIDCSGFVQMVYKQAGITLPRDAYQQAELGETISFVESCKLGDLAFFDNEQGKITHVGMMLNNHQIIHASGRVRIDTLDHHGIYVSEDKVYSHKLRIIKRIQ